MKLSYGRFWERFVKIPSEGGGLVCPTPTSAQEAFIRAVDEGHYAEYLLHWSKKSAKGFTAATRALHHLVADPWVRHTERRIGIASNDEEQSRITFHQIKGLIDRDPWLHQHVTVLRNEMSYVEHVRPKGGRPFSLEHRLIALPRDLKGTHGEPWTLIIRDELWTEVDHAFSEALILDPSRRGGSIVYLSYSAPRLWAVAGAPLHDLLTRVEEGDKSLYYSFIGGSGESASWRVCPWISLDWVEQQRRIFSACPSKFRRIILNEPAGPDSGLITDAELRAALDPALTEPATGTPGTSYVAGLDLGISRDWTALVVCHLDPKARVIVDVTRSWRGTPDAPVSLSAVETEVLRVARAFSVEYVGLDRWNAALLGERLQRSGVNVRLIAVEASRLDRIVTTLKQLFSSRLIRIAPSETQLLDQLSSVVAVEGRSARRDLLKFQPSGPSPGAAGHDDLICALGLALDKVEGKVGRLTLPAQACCWRELNGLSANCFIRVPAELYPTDPLCHRSCAVYQAERGFHAEHLAEGGTLPIHVHIRTHCAPHPLVVRVEDQRFLDACRAGMFN